MFILDAVSWWYSGGWVYMGKKNIASLKLVLDAFSISTLLLTLFSPFRETLTGVAQGSLGDKLRALGDRLFSRFIGFFVRIFVILAGLIVLLVISIFSLITLILWPLTPFLPILAIVLTIMGWTVTL